MKSKKGFTLIELLAIIVILAIIAVITVPIILNIIEDSKKGAALDSAYGFKDSINTYYVSKLGSSENFSLNKTFTIDDGKLDEIELNFSGTRPTSGTLTYQNNELVSGCLVVDGYKVEYNNGKFETTGKGECETFICEYGKLKKVEYEYIPGATQEQKQRCVEYLKERYTTIYEYDEYSKMCNGEVINHYGDTSLTSIMNNSDVRELIKIGIVKENIIDKRCLELNEFDVYDGELCGTYIEDEEFDDAILYGELNIPSTINGEQINLIGCFANQDITSVTIPNGVTTIDYEAFYGNQLTSITLPNSVISIGGSAFEANQLTNITIPSSVTNIGTVAFNSNQLPDNKAFIYKRNANGTEDVTTIISYGGANKNPSIPNGVTTIDNSSFRGTIKGNKLTSVTIPNSVTTIGDMAFETNELTSITIPNNVTTIGNYAFQYNPNLTINVIGYASKPNGWNSDWNWSNYPVNWNYGG